MTIKEEEPGVNVDMEGYFNNELSIGTSSSCTLFDISSEPEDDSNIEESSSSKLGDSNNSIMEECGVHPTTLSDDDDEDKALKELMKQFLTPRKNSTLTRSQTTKLCSFSLAQGYVDIPANERVKVTE